jgi:[FeFe] hydrogenase (group B1/B3)
MAAIPHRIIPGEVSTYRESVFLERAIVRERMRLAMGLPLRTAAEQSAVFDGAEECASPEKYYQPPLINIIKFACHSCVENKVVVTDQCQGCLAHPCKENCPKNAISFKNGHAVIDQSLCIKCERCMSACQYSAILHLQRPCAKACGMNAIRSDEYGRADIDQEKCVSCGMCLVNCPFGAIADKAQIFQVIQAIRSDVPVYAAIAPAVIGQLGRGGTLGKLRSALKALGFADVSEVAIGADLCTIEEARDFMEEVPEKLPFMGTSCCPAWSVMAKREFPEYAHCISMALTPMVLTGRLLKQEHPGCKVAFIGPCAAKKLEASRKSVRSDIDFVLTFEEVMGMFEAKEVDFAALAAEPVPSNASADGRGFSVSGGVAEAVASCIRHDHPEREILIERAEGLNDCRKMLQRAKAGRLNGYLLEGMACPGGCVGGAGTVQLIPKATQEVAKVKKASSKVHAYESDYSRMLPVLEE